MREYEEYRDATKEHYGFSSWAGKTKRPEGVLCVNFLIPFEEFDGLVLEGKEDLKELFKGERVIRYIYSRPDARTEDRVVINTLESGSVLEVHGAVISKLMMCAANLPTCESLGMDIGDVCYGGYGDIQSSVFFARYNVLIDIKSVGINDIPVSEFAGRVDSLIYCEPVKPEGPKGLQPVISGFILSSETTSINKEITVGIEASDPSGREFMIRMIGTGGTISRKGEEFIYRAEKEGKQSIKVYVVNEVGLSASDERWIIVE